MSHPQITPEDSDHSRQLSSSQPGVDAAEANNTSVLTSIPGHGQCVLESALFQRTGQWYEVRDVLAQQKSSYQQIEVLRVAIGPREEATALVLDGVVQIIDAPRHLAPYHEAMLGSVLLHPAPHRVLIVGGGDGCALDRVLYHKNVEVDLVEIDDAVVELSSRYLPGAVQDAFDNPRASLYIEDAYDFVGRATDQSYDVIIVDSSDPNYDTGGAPANPLYAPAFYEHCRRLLAPKGVLLVQGGTYPVERASTAQIVTYLQDQFDFVSAMPVAVPTYSHGPMMLVWASERETGQISEAMCRERFSRLERTPAWLTPRVLFGLLAVPTNIANDLGISPH